MEISFKVFNELPSEAKQIRSEVFEIEQGFVDEFDEDDNDALHIVMYKDGTAIGTSRVIFSKTHNSICIGRFAIIKSERNKGLGRKLLERTEQEIIKKYGHILVGLSSQERASNFYFKCGYKFTEERYLDQYCPHVWMIKKL